VEIEKVAEMKAEIHEEIKEAKEKGEHFEVDRLEKLEKSYVRDYANLLNEVKVLQAKLANSPNTPEDIHEEIEDKKRSWLWRFFNE
jgi:SMC interacting uncharacterized protein involved in chromosome segregation